MVKLVVAIAVLCVLGFKITVAEIQPATYSFNWKNANITEAIQEASNAFNIVVYVGSNADRCITLEIKTNDFEQLMAVICKSSCLPYYRFYVSGSEALTKSQAELMARAVSELRGLTIWVGEPYSAQSFTWLTGSPKGAVAPSVKPYYYVGYPSALSNSSSTMTKTTSQGYEVASKVDRLFSEIASLSDEDRAALEERLNALSSPLTGDSLIMPIDELMIMDENE